MATDSLIGHASRTLTAPGTSSPSAIGYATKTLIPPHHPMAFWNGSQLVWTPVQTWNGSAWV